MNLNARIATLETQAAPELPPITVHRVDMGYDGHRYFSETKEQALARSGIQPEPQDVVVYVVYTKEPY